MCGEKLFLVTFYFEKELLEITKYIYKVHEYNNLEYF